MGHAITASRPLDYRKTRLENFEAYRVNGTPADCVALGAHHWERVDLVLSGINLGLNLGNSCWHSGTLAAAKQAALLGLRGIAVSAPPVEDGDYADLEPSLERVLRLLLAAKTMSLVNVNLPSNPKGALWTRQSVRHYDGAVLEGTDPLGRKHFWFGIRPIQAADEGTDRWAVENNYVSITPLRLDLTDERELQRVQNEVPVE